MKAFLEKIPLPVDQSFSIKTDISKKFYNQWHYHPEIELVYIVDGNGTALIGDGIINIKKNDLILIGSNVPHMLRSDEETSFENMQITETTTIHFTRDILESFLQLPENKEIIHLLEKSNLGLNISGSTKENVIAILKSISFKKKTQRLISLLEILNILAENGEYQSISGHTLKLFLNKQDENRLNRIYHYTLNNFHREITLKEIADVIHLAPNAFCRYFKSRTKKRYSQFLLEVRVSHACKLLKETDLNIGVISFESGFMNLSNFNRHFKLITGKTPLKYKRQSY